jgi:hypothetical protein
MAYSTANPPALLSQGIGGFHRIWSYKTTDAATVVRTSNYITNGYQLGLRKGDLVMAIDTDAAPISMQFMIVNECTPTVCDLSDGTAVTATDTD